MRGNPKGTFGIWALVLLTGTAAAARQWHTEEWVEYENALTNEVPTPHTKWAKPYARGSVRVLFFGHKDSKRWMIWGPGTRFAVELMQRFDIDGDAVLVDPQVDTQDAARNPEQLGVYGGEIGEKRLSRLLEMPYDCYVFGTDELPPHIPVDARDRILDQVRKGAGLIIKGKIDESLTGELTKLDDPPPAVSGLNADLYSLGEGRVVAYRGRPWNLWGRKPAEIFDLAPIFGVNLAMDVDILAEGRALLWAARREPDLELSISVGPAEIPRAEISNHSIEVTWKGEGLTKPLDVAVRIRSQSRGSRDLPPAAALAPDQGEKTFPLPVLPAGRYWVDAVARSARGIESSAVTSLIVTSDEQVTGVKLDREWGEAGELIRGSVTVKTSHRAQRTLRVQAIDKYGRALSRQEWRSPGAAVAFSLPTQSWMPNMVGVEAVLMSGDEPISYAYSYNSYTIPHRRHDQFNFITWGRLYAGGYGGFLAEEALVSMGITSRIETTYMPWWFMTRAGMNYTPYCRSGIPNGRAMPFRNFSFSLGSRKHTIPKVDASGVLARADGCLNDEPSASENIKGYLDAEMDFRSHGVLVYSTGDEKLTFVSCLHPACWKKYLEYLALQYGSIDALNASWGTSFGAFAEIKPLIDETAYPEIEDEQDRRSVILGNANNAWSCLFRPPGSKTWDESKKNYPRWFDRRAFQYWNYAKHVERFREAARKIDPLAKSGQEGSLFGTEQDVDLIVRHTDWWVFYNSPTLEIARSIAPPGYTFGKWFGYDNSESNVSQFWWSFLRGSNCQAWWRVDHFLNMRVGPGRSRGIVESARPVFDGLGTLLNVRSRPEHDGIVMLHSFPSAQASYLEAGHSYGTYAERPGITKGDDWPIRPAGNMHVTWHRAIRSLGLQFEYVTDRMMRLGEFRPDEYKVMILSQCEALGTAEAQVIRQFVLNGGTMIADVRPGIYDGHCKPLHRGVLDDLFGVEHRGNVPAKQVDGGDIRGRIGEHEVAVDFAAALKRYPEYLEWLYKDLEQLNGSWQESFTSFEEAAHGLQVNPAVEVTTGTALGRAGETPICIVNEVGRGRVVLLNFSMSTFPEIMIRQTPEACADFLTALFASAGVKWPLHLLDEKGNRHRNVEAVRWKVGDGLEVVAVYGPLDDRTGMWRHYTPGVKRGVKVQARPEHQQVGRVRVRLPGDKHMAQIEGKQSGPSSEFTLEPRPRRPVFMVLGDRKLQAPLLTTGGPGVAAGQILQIEIEIPDAQGMHAVKIRAQNSDGDDAPWFARSIIVEDGLARLDLPIARNEHHGEWTITATDLYTQESDTASFEVE